MYRQSEKLVKQHLRHRSKFQLVSRVGFVTGPTSISGLQPNFARRLAVSCSGRLCVHCCGLLPPNGILPVCTLGHSAGFLSVIVSFRQ